MKVSGVKKLLFQVCCFSRFVKNFLHSCMFAGCCNCCVFRGLCFFTIASLDPHYSQLYPTQEIFTVNTADKAELDLIRTPLFRCCDCVGNWKVARLINPPPWSDKPGWWATVSGKIAPVPQEQRSNFVIRGVWKATIYQG